MGDIFVNAGARRLSTDGLARRSSRSGLSVRSGCASKSGAARPAPGTLHLFRAAAGRNKRGTRFCDLFGGGKYVEEHAHNVSHSDAK